MVIERVAVSPAPRAGVAAWTEVGFVTRSRAESGS